MPQLNEGNINSYLVPSGSLTGSLSNSGTLTGQIAIGSGGGTSDYNDLSNKPQINSVTLSGNKTTSDLNISYNDLDDKPTIPAAQVNSDWNAESGVAEILNKPTIPTKLKDLSDVNYSNPYPKDYLRWDSIGVGWTAYSRDDRVEGLSNVLTDEYEVGQVLQLTSISGQHTWRNQKLDYSNIVNTPTIPAAQVNSDWNAASGVAEILNKPTLATVATSGDYTDLTNTPVPAYENKGQITDLNNVSLDDGGSYKYIYNAGASNKPGTGGGTLLHMWNSGNHIYGCQVAFSDNGMYFRNVKNSVFGTWQTIVSV